MGLLLEQAKRTRHTEPADGAWPVEALSVFASLEKGPKRRREISRCISEESDLRPRAVTELLDSLVEAGAVLARENGEYALPAWQFLRLVDASLVNRPNIDVVGFVDHLLSFASELGSLSCTLQGSRILKFGSRGRPLGEIELPQARTILRVLCARLSVLCREQTGQEVSPYGDEAEFGYVLTNGKRFHLAVSFKNTTDDQEFIIQADPA
jgi:DNA-binding transcriptional ArsR family regulator